MHARLDAHSSRAHEQIRRHELTHDLDLKRIDELIQANDKLQKTLDLMYQNNGVCRVCVRSWSIPSQNLDALLSRIVFLEGEMGKGKEQLHASQKDLHDTVEWARRRALRQWQADQSADNCFNCDAEFTLLSRRHHCRLCGGVCERIVRPCCHAWQVYCGGCCNDKLMTAASSKPERVCKDCFDFMNLITFGPYVSTDQHRT